MKALIYSTVFLILLFAQVSCKKTPKNTKYETLSYLEININQDGNLPVVPYTVNLEKGKKSLAVCGTLHSTLPTDPMFESLEQTFNKVKPQKIVTEDKPLYQFYTSHNAAIVLDGETGFVRFLGNSIRVKPECESVDPKLEVAALLEEFTKKEVLVYLVCDRYLSNHPIAAEKNYTAFIEHNLIKAGMVLNDYEKKFSYFVESFESIEQKKFSIKELAPDDYLPIRNNGKLCEVARAAYKFKDELLLSKIETLLKTHDRILVLFSGWHVLAIEPALVKMFNNLKV